MAPTRLYGSVENCLSCPLWRRSDVGNPFRLVAGAEEASAIVSQTIAKKINANPRLSGFLDAHRVANFPRIEQFPALCGQQVKLPLFRNDIVPPYLGG